MRKLHEVMELVHSSKHAWHFRLLTTIRNVFGCRELPATLSLCRYLWLLLVVLVFGLPLAIVVFVIKIAWRLIAGPLCLISGYAPRISWWQFWRPGIRLDHFKLADTGVFPRWCHLGDMPLFVTNVYFLLGMLFFLGDGPKHPLLHRLAGFGIMGVSATLGAAMIIGAILHALGLDTKARCWYEQFRRQHCRQIEFT